MYVRELTVNDFADFVGISDCATALTCLAELNRAIYNNAQFVLEFSDDGSTASYGRQYSRDASTKKQEYLKKQLNNSIAMLLRRHCKTERLNWTKDRWNDLLYDLLASYSASFDEVRANRRNLRRLTPVYHPQFWPDHWVNPHAHWANKKYNL